MPVKRARPEGTQRLARIVLEEAQRIRLSPQVEHERRAALFDLIEDNRFAPVENFTGPFVLHLGMRGSILVFSLHDEQDKPLTRFMLPIAELRRLIKDYFFVCDHYFQAIKTLSPARIEAIDMGRRGLHNEGAELLRERLAPHVEVDQDTARRLFTLICVLQIRA